MKLICGFGNFDIRTDTSSNKQIRLHDRDVRILNRIQNYLHIGRVRAYKNKPYSAKEKHLNGLIRLKVPGFVFFLYNILYTK